MGAFHGAVRRPESNEKRLDFGELSRAVFTLQRAFISPT
jgi:hypothetical protein